MFEVGNIFPRGTDGSEATADEECLAKTLLRRLDLPDEPVVLDDEDELRKAASAAKKNGVEKSDEQPAERDSSEGQERHDQPAV
jgi:hypothetical protein